MAKLILAFLQFLIASVLRLWGLVFWPRHCTECRSRGINSSASYLGGPEFKSRTGDRSSL